MFQITLLPAAQGDALWIEYGKGVKVHRVLVDGGVQATGSVLKERIEKLPEKQRVFELGVVTHVDLDHILGMLSLLKKPPAGLVFNDFWFNAWKHLPKSPTDDSVLGAKMGEELSFLLEKRKNQRWNDAFGGKAVSVGMRLPAKASGLKTITLAGGMKLTVLGPTGKRLADLKPVWEKEIKAAGLKPGAAGKQLVGHPEDVEDDTILGGDPAPPKTAQDIDRLAAKASTKDGSKANGSSIVLLAEYEKKRALLTGDAFPEDVLAAVNLLGEADGNGTLDVDCWKLAHHGGEKNTSRELAAALTCPLYLVSTSGAKYRHPKVVSIARVLNGRPKAHQAELVFNYDSKYTAVWNKPAKFAPKYKYVPDYPETEGVYTVVL
jgi:beta-lactamase superfamily II metal-dependent hydrolase